MLPEIVYLTQLDTGTRIALPPYTREGFRQTGGEFHFLQHPECWRGEDPERREAGAIFPGTVFSPAFPCWAWVSFRFSTGSRPA